MLVIQRIGGQELRMLVLLPLYLAGPGLGLGPSDSGGGWRVSREL